MATGVDQVARSLAVSKTLAGAVLGVGILLFGYAIWAGAEAQRAGAAGSYDVVGWAAVMWFAYATGITALTFGAVAFFWPRVASILIGLLGLGVLLFAGVAALLDPAFSEAIAVALVGLVLIVLAVGVGWGAFRAARESANP